MQTEHQVHHLHLVLLLHLNIHAHLEEVFLVQTVLIQHHLEHLMSVLKTVVKEIHYCLAAPMMKANKWLIIKKAAISTDSTMEILLVGELAGRQTVMVEDVIYNAHHLHIITAQAEEI